MVYHQYQNDLRFLRFLHIILHLVLVLLLMRLFFDAIIKYQHHDESIRISLLDNDPDQIRCVNLSYILENFIEKKNESAKLVLMYLAYTMAIFVAMMLMIGQVWILISLYATFEILLLGFNLFFPFLEPYIAVAVMVASSCLSVICIIFKLRLVINHKVEPPARRPVISAPLTTSTSSMINVDPHEPQQESEPFLEQRTLF